MRQVDRQSGARRQSPRRNPPASGPRQPRHVQAILGLQAAAGNAAVSAVLQRAPAHAAHPSAAARGDAALLAMHLSALVGPSGRAYTPADLVGLSANDTTFFRRLYQVLWDHRFGGPDGRLDEEERESDLAYVRTALAGVGAELSIDPDGQRVLRQIQGELDRRAAGVTQNAVMERAVRDADLQAKLVSIEMADERAAVLAALQKGWGTYSKFSQLLEAGVGVAAKNEMVARVLKDTHTGLDTASKLAKALDPESYRTAVKEAREWCEAHHVGAGMGTVRAVALEGELVELTLGTANKVASTLSQVALWALKPSGTALEELEELAKAGELVGSGGKAAVRIAHVMEKLEKFETALNVVAVAAGVAKLITADSTAERVDAGVSVSTGALGIAAKVTGRAALGSAASSVLMTWEMVKFFGEMGAGATEGSMYGGLRQELTDMRPVMDRVALAMVPLDRALEEQDRRFGQVMASADKSGAEEAVATFAYRLQKALQEADHRWQGSHIAALARYYPRDVQVAVGQALQPDYPASVLLQSGTEFMGAMADAYHHLPDIVIDMMVDQGLMDPEHAERERKKLAEKRKEGAGKEGGGKAE